MYNVLKSTAYNDFLKQERKKNNLSTKDLSYLIPFSTGLINKIENSDNPLNFHNINYLFEFYGYQPNQIQEYDSSIQTLLNNFISAIVYLDDEKVNNTYNNILEISKDFKSTSLYIPCSLCEFVYSKYYVLPLNESNVEFLISNINYLCEKYQSLANMYLANYYEQKLDYLNAKEYFDKCLFNISKDSSLEDMYHYFLSNYYMQTNNLSLSINHRERAINLFGKTKNYRRIVNLLIQQGTQFIYSGNYKNAISSYDNALNSAKDNGFELEINLILHNVAFVYMLQNQYDKAAEYLSKKPLSLLTQKNCHAYMISLVNSNQLEKAKQICELGKTLGDNKYYLSFFETYESYFESLDLLLLAKNIEKILKKFIHQISILEIQFLHILLAYLNKKLGRYKKTTEHLECYIEILTKS